MQTKATLGKDWLLEKLKEYSKADLQALESPEVNAQNLIFALRTHKINVDEHFFAELAEELGLPFIRGDKIESRSEPASTLPYRVLVENLALLEGRRP